MTKSITNFDSLVGSRISIGISEPWEFENEVGTSTFDAIITDVYVSYHLRNKIKKESECLILHLTKPFGFSKLKTEYLMGSPRHEGNGLNKLANGDNIAFNFYRVSSERANSDNPFESTQRKDEKSFALIGALILKNH